MAKNQRLRGLMTAGLTVCLLLLPLTVSAQNINFDNTVNEIFQFFSLILTALQAVLWPVLMLMGGLLSNDLLFSGGMNTMLLGVWTHIRDFVNIIFVLGILFVAIYNIIGLAGENYSIAKVLPKIAIALIAVNFSFLMAKVVLDAVNVTTTAIFAVPLANNALSVNNTARIDKLSTEFCDKIINLEGLEDKDKQNNTFCEPKKEASTAPQQGSQSGSTTGQMKYQLTDYGKQFFSSFNSRNVALVMAIELMEITSIDEIKTTSGTTTELSKVKTVKELAINTIFSLIFFVIYATAFLALFITLLVRIVVLWGTIALMPLSFLGMAFEKAKIDQKNDPLSVFLTHALVPVKVALALTIGTIMITQVKQSMPSAAYATDATTLGAIVSNMSTLQEIMAGLATAAVVWMAAFWSMEGTKATPFVEKLKGYVENFGKGLAKLPLYAPILPIKTGKGTTEKVGLAFLGGSQTPMDKIFSQERDRYAKLTENKGEQYKGEIDKARSKAELDKVLAKISTDKGSFEQTREALAAKLSADNYKLAKNYETAWRKAGFTSAEDFVKAIREGKDSKGRTFNFEEFQTFAKEHAGIKPDFDVSADLNRFQGAAAGYKGAEFSNTEVGKAAKDLEAKAKVLSEAKSKEESDKAKAEAEKAFRHLEDIKKKLTEFSNGLPSGVTPTPDNKLPENIGKEFNRRYQELVQDFGQAQAKKTLVEALQRAGISNITKANEVATTIIAGQFGPATAPAPTPPGPGPTPPTPTPNPSGPTPPSPTPPAPPPTP